MSYFYIIAAIMLRLLPHPWNMSPLGAMFLFSGATVRDQRAALLAPLAALLLSDIAAAEVLHDGHYTWANPFTWLGFVVTGLLGWRLRRGYTTFRLVTTSLFGSISFFLLSNFGVWLGDALYPHSWTGLLECYAAGLPFFRNTLVGDLFYAAVMFGSYHWLHTRAPLLRAN